MKNLRPVLCVVAGPNGSGKTSTTEKLLTNEWTADSVYINPDNIAQEKYGDWNSEEFVDRAYVYDNSRNNELPQLLYRTVEGKIHKTYVENIALWATSLI